MDVSLSNDLESKLTRLAAQRGRESSYLIVEAVERLMDYDEWFLREVDQGLVAADNGSLIAHEDIRKLIDGRYPG